MASTTLKPPGKRSTVRGSVGWPLALSLEKRAPTEADARLIMNALLLPIYRWRPFPRPSLVPPWNRRSPALRGRGFSMRSMLMERIVLSNKVEKKAGLITKAGRGVARSVSGAGDQKIRAPTETDALFYNRIGAYGVLSPVVGDLVLGWFTVTSTPFWSD